MDADPSRKQLLVLLPAVSDAIRREADKISRAAYCDCNAGDVYMLATIHRDHAGSARPSDLIGAVYTTSAGVTGSLKRLESAGFIERSKTPQDGRVYLAVITDTGRKVLESTQHAFDALAARVTEGLSDGEVAKLVSLACRYLASVAVE